MNVAERKVFSPSNVSRVLYGIIFLRSHLLQHTPLDDDSTRQFACYAKFLPFFPVMRLVGLLNIPIEFRHFKDLF